MSGPGYPASAAGEPPSGQGYYHNNVGRRDDDRYERSPPRTQAYGGEHDYNNQRGYPPSEATYNPRDYQQDARQSAPHDDYASRSQANFDPERGQQRGGGGPPHLSRGNSYDTRADSEYTRGGGGGRDRDRDRDRDRGGRDYDDRSEYSRGPPASEYSRGPTASEYSRGPATASEYTSRSRSRGERGGGGGSRHSRRKSDRSRRSPSSSRSRSRSRDSYSSHSSSRSSRSRGNRRRRSARTPPMERAMGYPSDPKKGGRDVLGGSEREKGLGAALAGGAGGAWLGHEFGKGKLETIGGAIAGAIAARAIERHAGKRKEEKREKRRDRDRDRDRERGYGDGERDRDRRFDDAYTVASSSVGGRRSGEGRRRGSGSSDGYGRD